MILPRNLPPNSYIDDPAEKLDPPVSELRDLAFSLSSEGLAFVGEWITRGGGGITNRAFRCDLVLLSICPEHLPCRRPSAAWVGRQHGVSRQRASELWKEFSRRIGPYIQFRGQRFLNGTYRDKRRRGRERQKPQRGPVAGA
jgi:hypothetical protein